MEKRALIISSVILSVGILLAGVVLGLGVRHFNSSDRTVTVRGLSEIERPADHVIWPLSYVETGNDLLTLSGSVEAKNKVILAFLTAGGIPTQDITMSAPSITDTQAERYQGPSAPSYRYFLTQVITVSTDQVDKARELMIAQVQLLKSNIAITTDNWQNQTIYDFNNLDAVKPMMIEQATKNARSAAEKFAEDSKSELGGIKRAAQGSVSIEDRDQNTPYVKRIRVVTTIEYLIND